jgi:lipooligosaccharide transport system ATP-binding protein
MKITPLTLKTTRYSPETTALMADDLWKFYGKNAAVQGVSFTIYPEEILGLLGANGAGKTTTVGMLYGAIIPSRGSVKIGPFPVHSQGRQARNLMGIVTQEENLDQDFNVFENLCYFANHYRITGKAARHRAGELLAQVGLENYARNKIDELSGGLKRRLFLARALINRPQIVFLDEPTIGLDPHARQDFWRLVKELKQGGCGILLTTHYMDEAQRLCDQLLLLQQGKIIDRGTPTELIQRIVGQEVVEIEGIAELTLQKLAQQYQTWYCSFGSSYLIVLPSDNLHPLWEKLSVMTSLRLSRRPANLEDVFLRLTGELLE